MPSYTHFFFFYETVASKHQFYAISQLCTFEHTISYVLLLSSVLILQAHVIYLSIALFEENVTAVKFLYIAHDLCEQRDMFFWNV